MEWRSWIAFAATATLIGIIPGPGVASIVAYAISSGRKTALASVGGMAVGNVIAMTLSLAGVGALLAASALAFSIVKWAGAIYLIVLGIATIVRSGHIRGDLNTSPRPITPRVAFASNIAVGTFHPKTIIFFVAFVPQFISPRHSYLLQSAILIATFSILVATTDSLYALAASRTSNLLRRPAASTWSKRAGGAILIGAGAATAIAHP